MLKDARWLIALTLVGCGKVTDYLHHIVPKPPGQTVEQNYQIKDLVGDNKVDLLWVIDNSASMGDDQMVVIANTQDFMSEFSKKTAVDWKMGLISTSDNQMPFLGFSTSFDKNTMNAVPIFQAAVGSLGINGSGTEKLFEPVMRALNNKTFLRQDAMLALITITDAPEQSFAVTPKQFVDFLKAEKGDLKRVLAYGVLWPADWGCHDSGDTEWMYAGSKYEQFHQLVAGKTYSLCGVNFGKDLVELVKDIVKRVTSPRLPLKLRPKVETIQVKFKGNPLPGGLKSEGGYWLYDFALNSIVFHDLEFAPEDKESVQVTFIEAK